MNMIDHNYKRVKLYPVVIDKKSQAINDYILVFVRLQYFLPLQIGCREKLRPFGTER